MAMKARVTNANGRIIATKCGGVRSYHQHDALGNTIALITANAVTDTYTYWPYGELRTSTGSTVNPFRHGGAWGYYTDTTGRTYVRARTLGPGLTRWMTVDPLWPREVAYRYASASPNRFMDPSGLRIETFGCVPALPIKDCCDKFRKIDPVKLSSCFGKAFPGMDSNVQAFLKFLGDLCSDKAPPKTCIFCMYNGVPKEYPASCLDPKTGPKNPCGGSDIIANTFMSEIIPQPRPLPNGQPGPRTGIGGGGCLSHRTSCQQTLFDTLGCTNAIFWCWPPDKIDSTPGEATCAVLAHELAHAASFRMYVPHRGDPVYRIGCCMCRQMYPAEKCAQECSFWGDV